MGRKSKYIEIVTKLDKVKEYARNGLTQKEIGGIIGISHETFNQYLNKYPEFAEALKTAKDEADSEVIGAIFKSAIGYEVIEEHLEYTPASSDKSKTEIKSVKKIKKHIKPNVMAGIWWLYNRRRNDWKQKQLDLPELPSIPEFENLSDEELLKTFHQGLAKVEQD